MSFWTFTDIFEEGGPPTRPFHGGFGLINLQGIRKPAYFAYKFLAQLGPTDIATTDAEHSWATTKPNGAVQVLFWNYTPIVPPAGSDDQLFYNHEQPAQPAPLHPPHHRSRRQRRLPAQRLPHRLPAKRRLHRLPAHGLTRQTSAPPRSKPSTSVASGAPTETRTITITNHHFDQTFPMHQNDTVLVTLTPTH